MRGEVLEMKTTTEFFIEECCACGVLFGMTKELHDQRYRDKSSFYCPNGHSQSYMGKSDKTLRQEAEARARAAEDQAQAARRDAERAQREAETARAEARVAKAEAKRLKDRTSKGVCPVKGCKRSFVNVERHIRNQHPEYAEGHEH